MKKPIYFSASFKIKQLILGLGGILGSIIIAIESLESPIDALLFCLMSILYFLLLRNTSLINHHKAEKASLWQIKTAVYGLYFCLGVILFSIIMTYTNELVFSFFMTLVHIYVVYDMNNKFSPFYKDIPIK